MGFEQVFCRELISGGLTHLFTPESYVNARATLKYKRCANNDGKLSIDIGFLNTCCPCIRRTVGYRPNMKICGEIIPWEATVHKHGDIELEKILRPYISI